MVNVSAEKGNIDEEEKEFIQNIFKFDDLTAKDILVHRTKIDLLKSNDSIEKWKETIDNTRHKLYPICDNSADDIVSILDAKVYFRLDDKNKENVVKNATFDPYYVPENIKLDKLFQDMKDNHKVFALVVNNYGGTSGIVTMNDILEQLVGKFE